MAVFTNKQYSFRAITGSGKRQPRACLPIPGSRVFVCGVWMVFITVVIVSSGWFFAIILILNTDSLYWDNLRLVWCWDSIYQFGQGSRWRILHYADLTRSNQLLLPCSIPLQFQWLRCSFWISMKQLWNGVVHWGLLYLDRGTLTPQWYYKLIKQYIYPSIPQFLISLYVSISFMYLCIYVFMYLCICVFTSIQSLSLYNRACPTSADVYLQQKHKSKQS